MWQKRMVDTARGTFELFEKGEGQPLAITHLYSEYNERGNAFANPFTNYYKVYLINVRGVGNSVKAEQQDDFSMDTTIRDLEAIRQALGIQQWAVAGHSTGGMLALKYAVLAQDSLTKIIATGSAASQEYAMDVNSIYCQLNPNFNRIREIMNLFNNPDLPIEQRQQLSQEWTLMSFYNKDNLKKCYKNPNSGKTVGERLDYFRKVEYQIFDVREQLKSVQIPAFISAGLHDAQCPYRFSKEMVELLPFAQLMTFEYSNHFPFFEEEEKFEEFVASTC
ncbi:alpha/beta fold hydrolase [Metasolibacillus meyeri]|uniref:alpha/beta fold hydrolase n=1 Tax=Metasolibacillus meyeri TaxID=1071052 RepID=UPI000D30E049|nr:alpha/beta hydrolase [Metasolibacillus meyeri]